MHCIAISVNIAIYWIFRQALREDDGVTCLPGGGRVSDLDYADDLAILAHSEEHLQDMLDRICPQGSKVGLRINAAKTKVAHSSCHLPTINIGAVTLDNVDSFATSARK